MKPRISGGIVGYYARCPRQAWLAAAGIRMEQESDDVALGKLLDETALPRLPAAVDLEVEGPDGIVLSGRIDRINFREGSLIEIKKSMSAKEAHAWQLRFYLWLLRLAGVRRPDGAPFDGVLTYPLLRRTLRVGLEDAHVRRLEGMVRSIAEAAAAPAPPARAADRRRCRGCAYEEWCFA